ncbi:Tyrosine kinase family catalytic domain protein [Ceratobasidium sp. AG-Ba]|nr:Tyrosine kinase family catalytic domain protein [Ceratobasidium sp. AG-Ba]QRW09006.1 Tyrosine kinase family catalytic domain protein [Ceratobasidium sp. AG-Ba]
MGEDILFIEMEKYIRAKYEEGRFMTSTWTRLMAAPWSHRAIQWYWRLGAPWSTKEDTEWNAWLAGLQSSSEVQSSPTVDQQNQQSGSSVEIASSKMSLQQMFECLTAHGCTDLSSRLNSDPRSYTVISGGAFGDVYSGKLRDGTAIAIKALRNHLLSQDMGPKYLKRAMRELYIWSKAKHENVQELMGVSIFQERLGMISPWMANGNLEEYLRNAPSANRLMLCTQVANGLSYLHSIDMIHGDLKASNVLVDKNGNAKISDFDHSILSGAVGCTLAFTETSNKGGGTTRWMAPELLRSSTDGCETRSKEADVYALGMDQQEITTGKVPYVEYPLDAGVYWAIYKGELPTRPSDFSPPWMWGILKSCWDHERTARPPAATVHNQLGNPVSSEGL